jgi:hypothetical protein
MTTKSDFFKSVVAKTVAVNGEVLRIKQEEEKKKVEFFDSCVKLIRAEIESSAGCGENVSYINLREEVWQSDFMVDSELEKTLCKVFSSEGFVTTSDIDGCITISWQIV